MRRSRITITLDNQTLSKVDRLIDKNTIRNRSHAIEFVLNNYLVPSVRKAVILAGGQGTRLRPYTYELPKPLLLVQGKPLLEYLIAHLKQSGITEIIICIGYLGEKIKEHFGDGHRWGVHIVYSEETTPLQTGGALLKVKKYLQNEAFLVIHGDVLTDLPFTNLMDFHQKQGEVATVALTTVEKPSQFGQLTLQGTKLINFYQKEKIVKSHLINTGIYVFEPEIFQFFPNKKASFALEDIVENLIKEKKVTGFVFENQWFDVGNAQNYETAIKEFKFATK